MLLYCPLLVSIVVFYIVQSSQSAARVTINDLLTCLLTATARCQCETSTENEPEESMMFNSSLPQSFSHPVTRQLESDCAFEMFKLQIIMPRRFVFVDVVQLDAATATNEHVAMERREGKRPPHSRLSPRSLPYLHVTQAPNVPIGPLT